MKIAVSISCGKNKLKFCDNYLNILKIIFKNSFKKGLCRLFGMKVSGILRKLMIVLFKKPVIYESQL